MPKVYNRGVIEQKHPSGVVESDKGFKFPYSKAEIGDVMIDVDTSRKIVSKAEYREKWEKLVKETTKADEEALMKTPLSANTSTEATEQSIVNATNALIMATQALVEATNVFKTAMEAHASSSISLDALQTTGEEKNGSTQQ